VNPPTLRELYALTTHEFSIFTQLTEARVKQSGVSPDMVSGLLSHFTRFRSIIESFDAKRTPIFASHTLNDRGKLEALGALVRSTIQELDAARPKTYDELIGSLMRQTDFTTKSIETKIDDALGLNRVVDLLTAQEIRASLADLDPIELTLKYKEKAAQGNRVFVMAIDSAPIDPLVSKEVQEQGHQLLRESLFPKEAARLVDARQLVDALDAVWSEAKRAVMQFTGGWPLEDPLTEVAAGTRSAADYVGTVKV
jgi:PIN domain nuclease of toxin-antitoxin system